MDGIVLLDEQWRCVALNETAAELLETEPARAVGKTLWEALEHVLDADAREELLRVCSTPLPAHLGDFRAMEGRYVHCCCWPAGAMRLLTIVDTTDWREPLQLARDERARLEASLATLAHELRNPLSTLCQELYGLRGMSTETDKSVLLDRMERQLRYFVGLVDDLLDISRVVRGRVAVRRDPVRIGEVIADALIAVSSIVGAKGVSVHTGVPLDAIIHGDAVRLQQVLINLLKNAVSATDPGGSVFVSASRGDSVIEITVRDTGRGIESERLTQLFEHTYEHDAAAATGLGVGLRVVRTLVELHGGDIAAYSDGVGRGATFAVRLPSA